MTIRSMNCTVVRAGGDGGRGRVREGCAKGGGGCRGAAQRSGKKQMDDGDGDGDDEEERAEDRR